MCKIICGLVLLSFLGGCVPLLVGSAAGVIVANHEAEYHRRCMIYYGNPYCHVGYGAHRGWIKMPMGVHSSVSPPSNKDKPGQFHTNVEVHR